MEQDIKTLLKLLIVHRHLYYGYMFTSLYFVYIIYINRKCFNVRVIFAFSISLISC